MIDNRPHHFGNPCIHCGVSHDEMKPGPCQGDLSKAKPVAWRSLGIRHDGVERFFIRMSTGYIEERYYHISENAPYFHFGSSSEFTEPPRYDEKLGRPR